MKKIIYKILVGLVTSILLVVSFGTTNNFAFADSTFYFESGVIYGFNTAPQDEVNVVIPAEINGTAVEKLSNTNMEAIAFNNEDTIQLITGVDLSNATNLVEIGNVFYGCSYLSGTVVIPENIKTIYRYAFADTQISEVVINHTDTSLSMADTSFPEDTKILFQSQDIMNQYLNTYNIWSNYNLSYFYTLEIEVGNTIISVCKVENGQVLGSLYDEIVETYFAQYDVVELYQGDDKVDEDTVLDGSRLVLANAHNYTYNIDFDYGEEVVVEPSITGGEYTWKHDEEVISNDRILRLDNLSVGEYIYTCKIDDKVIVYNIVINPVKYEFSWPAIARYEYLEFSNSVFVSGQQDGKVNLEYFKYEDGNYNKVDALSVGEFKVVATPVDKNYYIENNTFEFELDYSYLTIVWPSNTYNYTGNFISPEFYLYGDLKGVDVKIMVDNSVLTASEIGKYSINVIGLSHPYFALTKETIVNYNWEIVSTELIVDWSQTEYIYGSNSITINGVYEDISIPLKITDLEGNVITLSNVGTYDVKVEIPDNYSGFSLNGSTSGTIEILPTKLEVVFISGDTYYYNGEFVTIETSIITSTSEDVELIIEDNYKKDAGQYTAKVVGVHNSNYYVDNIEFDWQILPKQLVVSWQGTTTTYNGEVIKPRATVDTGIAGETLALTVVTDNNINANEDGATGYLATATMLVENSNYQLANNTTYYFIKKATPTLSVSSEQSVMYNGKHQLPTYELDGDVNALRIYVDGVETATGVKEPGSYTITLTCEESENYLELTNEVICMFCIKSAELTNSIDKLNISVSHENGFKETQLNIEEITEHYIEITNEISKQKGYTLYKAFNFLGISEYENSNDVTITLNVARTNAERIKVFLVKGRQFHEVELTLKDGKVSFDGLLGTYYVFLENQIWIATTWGIVVMALIVVAGLVVLVYFAMFRNKNSEAGLIAEKVERKLQEKIANGEKITTEETLKIRQEVIDSLKQSNNDDTNNKKC